MKSSKYIAAGISGVALIWILLGIFFLGVGGNGKGSVAGTSSTTKVAEVRVRDIVAQPYANDIVVTGRTNASRTVEIRQTPVRHSTRKQEQSHSPTFRDLEKYRPTSQQPIHRIKTRQ